MMGQACTPRTLSSHVRGAWLKIPGQSLQHSQDPASHIPQARLCGYFLKLSSSCGVTKDPKRNSATPDFWESHRIIVVEIALSFLTDTWIDGSVLRFHK